MQAPLQLEHQTLICTAQGLPVKLSGLIAWTASEGGAAFCGGAYAGGLGGRASEIGAMTVSLILAKELTWGWPGQAGWPLVSSDPSRTPCE